MRHLTSSCLRGILGEGTTIQREKMKRWSSQIINHKIPQKHFQIEINVDFFWIPAILKWVVSFGRWKFPWKPADLWKSPFSKTPYICIMRGFKQKKDDHTSKWFKKSWRWRPRLQPGLTLSTHWSSFHPEPIMCHSHTLNSFHKSLVRHNWCNFIFFNWNKIFMENA